MNDNSGSFLTAVAKDPGLQAALKKANNVGDVEAIAKKAGFDMCELSLAHSIRMLAAEELKKHGLPNWAINSTLSGSPVCW